MSYAYEKAQPPAEGRNRRIALHEGGCSVARRPSQHALPVAHSRSRTPFHQSRRNGAISAIRHRNVAAESDLREYDGVWWIAASHVRLDQSLVIRCPVAGTWAAFINKPGGET